MDAVYLAGGVHGHRGADALAVADGLIAWIGRRQDAPRAGRTVDLDQAWLAPAFVDAHVHVTSTGLAMTGLDLTGCSSLAEALRRVEAHTRAVRGGVVLGTGWDETQWPEQRPPTARELDRASAGSVVYLARTDVHSAVVSSALLAAVPEAAGLPGFHGDGLVRLDAHHLVRRTALSSVSPGQRRAAQKAALDAMASVGIGSVHECAGPDISGEPDLIDLLALEHPVERIAYWGELGAVERARDLGAVGAAGDLFVDGALGSCTAALTTPYLGSEAAGHAYLTAEQVAQHVVACTRAGMQAGFHAIGDAAVATVTAGLRQAAREAGADGVRSARHRVEHLEMVGQHDIEVLAELGVVASVQPVFDARWGGADGMYAQRLGAERALPMNPFRALSDAGVALALGSDSPVTPPAPWEAVRSAVQHQTPGSGLSVSEAFTAHTEGGWRAARRSGEGRLAVGLPATFAAWQVEQWDGPLPAVSRALPRCLSTVVRGNLAYV
jgi:predicted amidohydrolase YtcJ